MIDFNVKCPKNYPLKCNLTDVEREELIRVEKYKAFLMYQFREQQEYVIPTIKKYFKSPLYFLFDAQKQGRLLLEAVKY